MRTCDRCGGIVAKPGQVIEYGPGQPPPILCHCPPHKDSYLNQGQLGTLALGTQGCFCRGPQNGAPACPCQMRDVQIIDGRYVRVTDLGPAPAGRTGLKTTT